MPSTPPFTPIRRGRTKKVERPGRDAGSREGSPDLRIRLARLRSVSPTDLDREEEAINSLPHHEWSKLLLDVSGVEEGVNDDEEQNGSTAPRTSRWDASSFFREQLGRPPAPLNISIEISSDDKSLPGNSMWLVEDEADPDEVKENRDQTEVCRREEGAVQEETPARRTGRDQDKEEEDADDVDLFVSGRGTPGDSGNADEVHGAQGVKGQDQGVMELGQGAEEEQESRREAETLEGGGQVHAQGGQGPQERRELVGDGSPAEPRPRTERQQWHDEVDRFTAEQLIRMGLRSVSV